MQVPLQITLRGMEHTNAIENDIRKKVEKLQNHYKNMVSCQVVGEITKNRTGQGKLYNIQIKVELPGRRYFIVDHNPREDFYVAVHDAFKDMTRQLENGKEK